jgi:hypothetical protein
MPDEPARLSNPEDPRLPAAPERGLSYWARQLGVTREELRSALESAGAMVKEQRVEHQVRKQRQAQKQR